MKIVLFGDSLLKNFGKDNTLKFEAAVPGADIYNCAVGGWDTNDGVKKAPYVSKLKPDITILGFGTNDAAAWKQVPLEEFLDNIPKITESFKESRIIYFLPPPIHPQNGHDKDHWRFPEQVKQYHDEAKKLLQDLNIEYLDSHAVFQPMLDKDERYHAEDGVHFNDHGYEVLIDEFAKIINT